VKSGTAVPLRDGSWSRPRAEEARGAPGARRRRRRPRRAAATSAPRPARPRSRPPARTAPRRPRRRAARSCPAPRRSPRASSWCRPRCQVRARCTPHPTLAPGASPARTCLLSGAEPGARRARAQPLTLPEPGGCAAARAPGPESLPRITSVKLARQVAHQTVPVQRMWHHASHRRHATCTAHCGPACALPCSGRVLAGPCAGTRRRHDLPGAGAQG